MKGDVIRGSENKEKTEIERVRREGKDIDKRVK